MQHQVVEDLLQELPPLERGEVPTVARSAARRDRPPLARLQVEVDQPLVPPPQGREDRQQQQAQPRGVRGDLLQPPPQQHHLLPHRHRRQLPPPQQAHQAEGNDRQLLVPPRVDLVARLLLALQVARRGELMAVLLVVRGDRPPLLQAPPDVVRGAPILSREVRPVWVLALALCFHK